MSDHYKPEGYSTVSPYLIVDGARRAIDFLVDVFGATELRRMVNEDGTIMHAEVRLGDSVVMLADSVANWPPGAAHIHVYVEDVDAIYRRALAAGATALQPVQKDDADKRGGIRDVTGTTWWIATRVG